MYSTIEHDVLGDLRCTGVDVDAWKKENRIPLYRGVNTWVMAYAGDPGDFDSIMRKGLSEWMSGSGGVADLYTVVESLGEKQPTQLLQSAVANYSSDLKTYYFLTKEYPTRYYKISFRWQSQNEQQVYIPWPVYNNNTFSSAGCTLDATVGVFYVLKPQQLKTAEEVTKMVDELNKNLLSPNVPASAAAQASVNVPGATTTPWYRTGWAIGGGALLLVGGLLLFSGGGKKQRHAY